MPRTGSLIVKGGDDKDMGNTLAGTYIQCRMNHEKPVFKRQDSSEEEVLLYYWDDRDGQEQSGWWFGPEVGGEEVWVHNETAEGQFPPSNGWRVLISNTVDRGFTVSRTDAIPPQPKGSVGAQPRGSVAAQAQNQPTPPAAPMRPGQRVQQGAPQRAPGPSSTSRPVGAPRPPSGAKPTPQPSAANKRAREEDDNAKANELKEWLHSLDEGAGAMLTYFDVLKTEFDADLGQIAAAKVDASGKGGILGAVDPSFWDTVKVQKTGHKMLFARGIAKL
jgi:hypothetical protein